ncbi:MerR family transcriptional regulator [Palleronia rufa]|uniref:MerR family transcriptional regulator n=1 Tax=Palleronia rufa TaxID=1530186 RepID=UPI0006893A36|nr:MerR family transcriptional regulator [Palleronia rufa]
MASKSPQAFRTISEVAEWLNVPAHVLRFWESRFTQVKPVKRAGGRRYYRPADMELLGGIKRLLHDDGMTIRGVQKMLREDGVRQVASLSPPLHDGGAESETNVVSLSAQTSKPVPDTAADRRPVRDDPEAAVDDLNARIEAAQEPSDGAVPGPDGPDADVDDAKAEASPADGPLADVPEAEAAEGSAPDSPPPAGDDGARGGIPGSAEATPPAGPDPAEPHAPAGPDQTLARDPEQAPEPVAATEDTTPPGPPGGEVPAAAALSATGAPADPADGDAKAEDDLPRAAGAADASAAPEHAGQDRPDRPDPAQGASPTPTAQPAATASNAAPGDGSRPVAGAPDGEAQPAPGHPLSALSRLGPEGRRARRDRLGPVLDRARALSRTMDAR